MTEVVQHTRAFYLVVELQFRYAAWPQFSTTAVPPPVALSSFSESLRLWLAFPAVVPYWVILALALTIAADRVDLVAAISMVSKIMTTDSSTTTMIGHL